MKEQSDNSCEILYKTKDLDFFFGLDYLQICEHCKRQKQKQCCPQDSNIKPVNPKGNQPWIFTGGADAEVKVPILWPPDVNSWLTGKDSRCLERLKTGEGGDRGWDGWMALTTQWVWVWANFKRWGSIGKPGVLQSIGSQRVGHNLVTEQQRDITRFSEWHLIEY